MKILTQEIKSEIEKHVISSIFEKQYDLAAKKIPLVIEKLYANIPDNNRISYGIVHTIKVLSKYLYTCLVEGNAPLYGTAVELFQKSREFKSKCVSLGILSFYGLGDYKVVLVLFESAAASSDWNVREMAQMFFRKLISQVI